MHKTTVMFLTLALLVGIFTAAGCGSSATTTQVTSPKVATTTPKTTGQEQKKSYVVTDAEFGAPVYPGARMDENAGFKNAEGVYDVAELWTNDSTDKVIAWYKEKLAGMPSYHEQEITEGGVNEIIFDFSSGGHMKRLVVGAGKVDHPNQTVIAIGTV